MWSRCLSFSRLGMSRPLQSVTCLDGGGALPLTTAGEFSPDYPAKPWSSAPRLSPAGRNNRMKWVYIIFGMLGGLVPGIYIFSRFYANPLLGGLDLVLLSLGIGVLVTPLFLGAGLVVARLVHMALRLLRRYRGGHRFLTDRPKGHPATGDPESFEGRKITL